MQVTLSEEKVTVFHKEWDNIQASVEHIARNDRAETKFKWMLILVEASCLLITLVIDILCSVYVWNKGLGPGYATTTPVFKDWKSSLVLEKQKGCQMTSDLYHDLHCICEIMLCIGLSFYELEFLWMIPTEKLDMQ